MIALVYSSRQVCVSYNTELRLFRVIGNPVYLSLGAFVQCFEKAGYPVKEFSEYPESVCYSERTRCILFDTNSTWSDVSAAILQSIQAFDDSDGYYEDYDDGTEEEEEADD